MDKKLLFVVDDDRHQQRILRLLLESKGYRVKCFDSGEACLEAIDEEPATVFLDLVMPGIGGKETLKALRQEREAIPVIMVTNIDDVETVVELVKLGAFDYLLKPVDESRLIPCLQKATERHSLVHRVRHLEQELQETHTQIGIVGNSPALANVLEKVDKVKDSRASVLLLGESGTGKELLARAIHYGSRFREGLFVDINCGAIPDTLQDSELFGHKKGAFTGAVEARTGKLELASGGTLFLDEVAEMSPGTQTKLLRVLQEKTFERIGDNTRIHVDLRVISATNKDLKREVAEGRFREDLYYRLAVFPIEVPPLRERKEDIPRLSAHILKKYRAELDKEVKSIIPQAMDALMHYHWPGNVRQLENAVYQAMIDTDSSRIEFDSLPPEVTSPEAAPVREADHPTPRQDPKPLQSWDEVQKQAAAKALRLAQGNIPRAARQLGLARSTFYRMVKKFGLR
ncbi:MAG: sigma-54-dependent Fis family transcriptional regulator [Nitrospinaceae bacterium]|nr:MAG: sigma-54-dependent Fis family transcriptional regulator [Nitrospinaceae bacterium]